MSGRRFVVNELNSINKCFVNIDADGITEIMKRAEENTEFYVKRDYEDRDN